MCISAAVCLCAAYSEDGVVARGVLRRALWRHPANKALCMGTLMVQDYACGVSASHAYLQSTAALQQAQSPAVKGYTQHSFH